MLKAFLNVRRQKVKGSNIQIAGGNLNAVVWNKRSRESRTKQISVYRQRMAANGSRRNHGKRKKHEGRENQGIEEGWDRWMDEGQRGGEGKGDKKGQGGMGTAKRQKRRLDYTSPAARSLFGRNRFFITKSLTGFIPNCTFGDPCKTHRDLTDARALESRGMAHNWSLGMYICRACAAYNFRQMRNKRTRAFQECCSRWIFNLRKWIMCQS